MPQHSKLPIPHSTPARTVCRRITSSSRLVRPRSFPGRDSPPPPFDCCLTAPWWAARRRSPQSPEFLQLICRLTEELVVPCESVALKSHQRAVREPSLEVKQNTEDESGDSHQDWCWRKLAEEEQLSDGKNERDDAGKRDSPKRHDVVPCSAITFTEWFWEMLRVERALPY